MQAAAKQFPDLFKKMGPGGITAAEAVGDLPDSRAEAARRIEMDRINKEAMEFAMKASHAANEQAKKAAKEAEQREDEGPNDPFNQVQLGNTVWLASGKPRRDAARKAAAKAAKDARAAAADDVRDSLRDIDLSGEDAG